MKRYGAERGYVYDGVSTKERAELELQKSRGTSRGIMGGKGGGSFKKESLEIEAGSLTKWF